jgi:hypothetical protein
MKFESTLVSACAIVIGLSVNSFTQAKIIKREVSANKSTGIYGWYQFNRNNCGAGMVPKYTVKSVEHGKIVGGVEIYELKTRRCKGKPVKGLVLKYTPNQGFRGLDNAKVILTMPRYLDDTGYNSRTLDFRIQVK